jgi:peptidoglycan hydrolase FlgJ
MNAAAPSTVSLAGQRRLAADAGSLNQLSALAGKDSKAAVKETSRQFEALFMQELLKSMRSASLKSGLVDNEQSDLGTQLLDQQWAQQMTGLPGGIGELIEKQLARQVTPAPNPTPAPVASLTPAPPSTVEAVGAKGRQAGFIARHWEAAQQVERESGIPAGYMLGQAGLETGWGRSPIKNADGSHAHNLFGIKAGPGWKGKVAEVTTTEYIDGVPRKMKQRFRSYDSPAESLRDYARMIGTSPRYAQVMQNLHTPQAFASSMQKAGYATGPQYAAALTRTIQSTLMIQRAQA